MGDQVDEVVRLWKRIPADRRPVVLQILRSLTVDKNVEVPTDINDKSDQTIKRERCIIPQRVGVHALLKLGMANTPSGPIPPFETLRCLDQISTASQRTAYLGTSSQSVSDKYRQVTGGIVRLYILVGKDVVRVVDVDAVLNHEEFEDIRSSEPGVVTCPSRMERARTWFRIVKIWKVAESPVPDDIVISRTGRSIAPAISAGRATFFYVQPLNNLVVEAQNNH